MDRPQKLLTLSLACFGAALAMPSVRVQIVGAPTDLVGWQASCWAFGLGSQGLLDVFVLHPDETWRYIGLALSAVMNAGFALALVALARKRRSKTGLRWLIAGAAVGLVLAVADPWLPENPPALMLGGYYMWLLAYGLLLSALVCAWRQCADAQGPAGQSGLHGTPPPC